MKLGPRQNAALECLVTRESLGLTSIAQDFAPRVLKSLVARGLVATQGVGPSRNLTIYVRLTSNGLRFVHFGSPGA